MARKRRKFGNQVTLAAVAEKAGVSPMTVSNVLNSKPNVTAAKREAVMKAVQELNYQPNRAARALASASHLRIGLLHRDLESSFLGQILLGSLRAANRQHTEIAVWAFDPTESGSAIAAAQGLFESGIDGLILPPPLCENQSIIALGRKAGVPMVALAPGANLETIPSVRINDEAAAYDLSRLILAKGHRRIGFVRFSLMESVSRSRHAGHLRALAEFGIEPAEELVWTGRPTYDSGLQAAAYFLGLDEPPTAVFSSSDDIAAAIVNYAHRKGLRVPEDLSVAGFDDAPIASQVWPPLTTVRQSVSMIAELATDRLLTSLKQQSELPAQALLVDYELIERLSLGERVTVDAC